MRMNPEVKTRWVAALRSGGYEQGKGYLSLNGEFCCLGVLCELAVEAGVIGAATPSDVAHSVMFYGDEDAARILPWEVMEWSGVYRDNGKFQIDTAAGPSFTSLSVLNDSGSSFSQIADLIEYHF